MRVDECLVSRGTGKPQGIPMRIGTRPCRPALYHGPPSEYAPCMLDEAVKAHKPHPKSLKDESSKEAYNEKNAREAFGDEFIDQRKKSQVEFKGDWWQLGLLVRNLKEDEQDPEIKDEERLRAWNKWRHRATMLQFEGIHLEHANLAYTHLEHANLEYAHLEHADLRLAYLEHANLYAADFEGADVRGADGLRFNGNRVVGIRIKGNAPDPWSVLRRQYTGPWFFVHLLLLAIFFAPYFGHALYLTAKSQFQEWSTEQYNALGERAGDVPGLSEVHAELQRRFREEHEQRRAVWVLLGVHRGFLPIVLAAIVVLYNAGRGFLTLRVSLLRDAEERSHTTPGWDEYKRLHTMHRVASILLLVALAAVAYNTLVWMVTTWIWVPVGP